MACWPPDGDDLALARGLVLGIPLSLVIWGLIGLAVWRLWP